ncbi:cupin domain-containing protein, partial [Brevibacterium aurantiacum]
ATPRRQEGVDPHRDGVNVFVVQMDGSKRWWLWRSQRSDLSATTSTT